MNKGMEQLKIHEGFGGRPYKDTVDIWTIGYGRNLEANPLTLKEILHLFTLVPMTKEQAGYLVDNNINDSIAEADKKFSWLDDMNEPRRWVVYNMVFNMGLARFLHFKNTIKAGQMGDYELFSKEMLDSKWAKQVGGRANQLSHQMKTGEWQ